MLAIRLQRTGRRGHAQFRVVVQDSRFHPTRGKVVAYLGSYDPHAKTSQLDKELAAKYLDNGAQPSDRVAKLLQAEGLKLPEWVTVSPTKERQVRNPDKRRSTRPEAPVEEAPAPEVETSGEADEASQEASPEPETTAEEVAVESAAEEVASEPPTEEAPAEEAPAEEPPAEELADTKK